MKVMKSGFFVAALTVFSQSVTAVPFAHEARSLAMGNIGVASAVIATAAFGSNMTTEVLILRSWRDEILLSNNIGKNFVQAYYTISPPIANVIRKSKILRKIVAKTLGSISKAAKEQIKD